MKRTGEAHSIVVLFVKTVLTCVAQSDTESKQINRTGNGREHQIFGIADTMVFPALDAIMGAKRRD